MSLSFACPQCRAMMEVPDELAGQSGQCPRCQHVFTIPSPKAPPIVPVGKAVPGAPTRIPPTDPWARDVPRDDDRPRSSERGRPRRARSLPPQPSGPMWPWFVGILGALVVGGLLFASFLVLVAWRKPMMIDHRQAIRAQTQPVVFNNQRVTVGQFDGQTAFLDKGVFQVKSELNQNDPADPQRFGCRRKVYQVELKAFQNYFIDLDSNQFDGHVRLERFNNFVNQAGFRGLRNIQLQVFPQQHHEVYTIYVSSVDPANGPFTLTVREQHLQKPNIP